MLSILYRQSITSNEHTFNPSVILVFYINITYFKGVFLWVERFKGEKDYWFEWVWEWNLCCSYKRFGGDTRVYL